MCVGWWEVADGIETKNKQKNNKEALVSLDTRDGKIPSDKWKERGRQKKAREREKMRSLTIQLCTSEYTV